eukprot:SAG31_NODE_7988_length_1546_cov_4.508815_1_plen_256_part_10
MFGPANELASVDEVFSLAAWADNILGLVMVLSIFVCVVVTVMYSFCKHIRNLRETKERVVDRQTVLSTTYAKRLLAQTHDTTAKFCKNMREKIDFKLKTQTKCGSLLCHYRGDPFSRAQRITIILMTMLASLYFNILFFVPGMEPVCANSTSLDNPTVICKTYVCPSCYQVYGRSSCDDAKWVAPLDLCVGYMPGKFSSHAACEQRPFEACRINSDGSLTFVDPIKFECADESAEMIKLMEVYTLADSRCYEFEPG